MRMALEGIRVLDVAQIAAAPMAARLMADFGADVVHVEHPVRGDTWRNIQNTAAVTHNAVASDVNYNWENFNRNKRGVTIDLSHELGRKIIYKLVEKADVFVTNLRPWEIEKFCLEYATLHQINPKLIYGSLTGYGNKGAERDKPAFDTTAYWRRAGFQYRLSRPGAPCLGGTAAIGDNVAAMALAFGIMTALYNRDRTGEGQEVEVSLLHTGIYHLSFDIAGALATGKDYKDWWDEPPKELVEQADAAIGRITDYYRERAFSPLTTMYTTKDGRELVFSVMQPDLYWSKFCKAIGREDLEHNSRYATFEAQRQNSVELIHIIAEVIRGKTLDEWKPRLSEIPFETSASLLDVIQDPQARANDVFVPFDHPTYGPMEVISNPVKLSQTPASVRTPAPEFSQHTEEVLLETGYSWEDIQRFKEQGIIA